MSTMRLFITGTDTGVGKTHFTVWWAGQLRQAGFRVGVYKPVCSGVTLRNGQETWDDAELLGAAIDGAWPIERIAPQCFRAPLAPPVAAALESRQVDETLLVSAAAWWEGRVDVLLIEGAGGWHSPVSGTWTNAQLAERLKSPVVLVAGNRLGVINHTLLSIAVIQQRSRLLGVVLNELSPPQHDPELPSGFDLTESNADEIERRAGVGLWGVLSHGPKPELRRRGGAAAIDWKTLLTQDQV